MMGQKSDPGVSLTNQKSNTKFVSMKGPTKTRPTNNILSEIDRDFEDIMNKRPFGLEQDEDNSPKKRATKSRGKSPNTVANRKSAPAPIIKANYVDSMFNLGDDFRTQVNAVMIADEILLDLKEHKNERLSRLE